MAAGGASAWHPEQTFANSSRPRPILTLNLNGKDTAVDADSSTPILWALGDTLGLTGTKFGCGAAQCGYCQSGQIMSATTGLRETQHALRHPHRLPGFIH